MSRLSRAELQLRTRAKVLAAARAEFAEHGYGDTTIDRIAARADLTRGAVYSNFPGKRALYFSTLTPHISQRAAARQVTTPAEGLAAFASAWLDQQHPGPEVLTEPADLGTPYAGLLGLNAVLLGLSLDASPARQRSPGRGQDLGRMIRISRLALTLLAGADQLTSAPGFVQPFAVARACAHLADIDVDDPWRPPPTSPPIRPADEAWSPPAVTDEVLGRTADLDGVIVVLGLNRLSAAEDVVRTTDGPVTIALVSSSPDELGPLARYTTGALLGCLRQAVPGLQLVHDEDGVLASALGCDVIGDDLEFAASVADGRIVARAESFGAAHAIAQLLQNTCGR
ncbi:helix-turn-helix domain-containing protein [Kribbella sp. NPDC026596]|uniref:TetR/AcrR family transcriptional regulator n=1 Tax=Kribbella sp. NPDC026596 TaxID=3155122 RepID=UPI0033FB7F3C